MQTKQDIKIPVDKYKVDNRTGMGGGLVELSMVKILVAADD
jgi:hypothetical protein